MSKQAYHAMTMYASARKKRKAATGTDFATAVAVTDPSYKYEGQLTPSHKIDIATKSGSDEQSAMILSYAWGEVVHDVGDTGDSYLGSAYMSHMTDLVLVFEEGVKFKDNIHLLDESENRQWLPSGHMIRIPLSPSGDRWNVADNLTAGGQSTGEGGKMHSPFHTSLDMVLPLEELNSGGISYKLFYADVDSNGALNVVTGEHLASFGLHMQITGPDIGR